MQIVLIRHAHSSAPYFSFWYAFSFRHLTVPPSSRRKALKDRMVGLHRIGVYFKSFLDGSYTACSFERAVFFFFGTHSPSVTSRCQRLAAARARSGSFSSQKHCWYKLGCNTSSTASGPPSPAGEGLDSIPSRRFATSRRKALNYPRRRNHLHDVPHPLFPFLL